MPTAEEYYGNPEDWGNYQYIPASDIISGLELLSQDQDSFLKNTKRSQILYHVKRGIREFARTVASNVRAFEITINPDDLSVVFPQNYVSWVRVSVVVTDEVTGGLRLQPLNINRGINTAIAYLQDNNYQILFDDQGEIITADGANAYAQPYRTYSFCDVGGQPFLDTSKLSRYGEFKDDTERGCFIFSENLADKNVVIEYLSDDLDSQFIDGTTIRVHKYLDPALIDYAYYNLIAYRRNVPAGEKYRAQQKMKASIHKAKVAMSNFDLIEIGRIMRQTTQIP